MLKTALAGTVFTFLPIQEQQRPKAVLAPVCVVIGVVVVTIGVCVIIRACESKRRWRCVWDSDQEKPLHRWVTSMTLKAIAASGYIVAGNRDGYSTEAECKKWCCDDPVPPKCVPPARLDDDAEHTFSIQSSTDARVWYEEEQFVGFEGDIDFTRTFQDACRFFRVMLVP